MSRVRNDGVRDRTRARVDRLVGPVRAEMIRATAERAAALTRKGVSEARAVQVMHQAGMIGLGPTETAAELRAISAYGQLGAPLMLAALKHGDRTGLIDELGSLTFAEMNERAEDLAAALSARGVTDADCVGILCRNHRGLIDASFAAARLGTRILYLNSDLSGPQLEDTCRRERVSLLIHDEEFGDLLGEVKVPRGVVVAWQDRAVEGRESLESLIRAGARLPTVGTPRQHPRIVLLTSGTTGAPKGALRSATRSLAPVGAMLSKVPYRADEATYIAPPMSHGVGYSQMLLSMSLGCTLITERHFDADRVLGAVTAHHPTAMVLVPVMLRRILGVLERGLNRYDLSSLRIVFVSGATLEPDLVRRAQVSLGPVLYNFYGSTEVAYVTFATPSDLREAPGCAGRPPFGTVVRLYDELGREVTAQGRVGRIFVSNAFPSERRAPAGPENVIDGLMATGDVGHFDAAGRLWVDGRDDEMIVSRGEDVFPGEVEHVLAGHPAVDEAGVIGVGDEEHGQRLAAFVVMHPDQQLSPDQIRAFVRANLAQAKVPRDVYFVTELPRNPAGQVLKRELRALHEQLIEDAAES